MSKPILLLQFRDDAMREHEYRSVLARGELSEQDLVCVDALTETLPEDLSSYRAVLLGGSGRYCVSKDALPVFPNVFAFLRRAREEKVPVLGICFGAHLLTAAFGGEVHHRPEIAETGSYETRRLPASGDDPLFRTLPETFWAQMGHKDFIGVLPPGAVPLVASERAEYQAWTFPGEAVYAVQFHPELTKEGVTERILFYLNEYIGNDRATLERIIAEAKPSLEATSVLTSFLHAIARVA